VKAIWEEVKLQGVGFVKQVGFKPGVKEGVMDKHSGESEEEKEKKRKSIYIALFTYYVYLKTLRHGSHSFYLQITPCLPFLRKRSPDSESCCLLAVCCMRMTLCCCRRRVLDFDILSMSVYSLAVTGTSVSILLRVN